MEKSAPGVRDDKRLKDGCRRMPDRVGVSLLLLVVVVVRRGCGVAADDDVAGARALFVMVWLLEGWLLVRSFVVSSSWVRLSFSRQMAADM